MQNSPILSVKDLSVEINHNVILREITLEVFSREILTIVGPNGAGKTTLLKVMLGLIKPSKGVVSCKNNLRVGYVPQKIHITSLMPMTVMRFLQLSQEKKTLLKKIKDKLDLEQNIQGHIEMLGISKLLNTQLLDLSGGELQRVLFVRALINNPEFLVLDEPAQGVDAKGQIELYGIIADIKHRHNCAIIIVSHDLHLVASQTNKVICLNKHICCSGYPESVWKHPEFVNLFGYAEITKLAVYTHKHDHIHDISGKIVKK